MNTTQNYFRRAFTLIELLAVIGVIAVLMAIAVPFIQSARDDARRNQCINNLKQIGLCLLNYEDKRKALPPISTSLDSTPDIPGDATADEHATQGAASASTPAAGLSWMVLLRPELCDSFFSDLIRNVNELSEPAFSRKHIFQPGSTALRFPTTRFQEFRCPGAVSEQGEVSPRTVGSASGIETGSTPPNYLTKEFLADRGIGITSYNAIAGTHIDPSEKSVSNPNNGGMLFRGRSFGYGLRLRDLSDGTSTVPIVCETREQRFSSWYDGTMNWVVAARHGDPAIAPGALNPPVSQTIASGQTFIQGVPLPSGRLIIGSDGTSKTGGTALNFGPTRTSPTAVYLPAEALADPDISAAPPGRLWGPSSLHRGGIVNHVFADGHVESIKDDIEPNLYLWRVTRSGAEPGEPCGGCEKDDTPK